MGKRRLDGLLIDRGLVASRQQAQGLIMAGQVLVNEQMVDKPGKQVPDDAEVKIRQGLPYVSRGGLKLEHALERFGVDVHGLVVADVGASTGGFTDCLLQRGACLVYAIDVGYGQLAWRLRQDPRVVVLDRTNVRYLKGLPDSIDLATVDVSFISLEMVLPAIMDLLRPRGEVIALIKPQFEAGRGQVGKGGVVKDREVHRRVLERVTSLALDRGLQILGLTPSPLKGPAGNLEFFTHLSRDPCLQSVDAAAAIAACIAEAEHL
jgi:23S rRNA (cytidine1920-2'-O)/16S rRNA (cytidine1409-2'-O)-methyltransferase